MRRAKYERHPADQPGPNVFRKVGSSECARKIEDEQTQKDASGEVTVGGINSWYFWNTGRNPGRHFEWSCTESDSAIARKAKIDAEQPLTAQEQIAEDKCARVQEVCGF